MNIVLIPCIKGVSQDLETDYSDYENLSRCALISYNSAIRHIKDADQIILFHRTIHRQSIQEIERRILETALQFIEGGDCVLILEADTICVQDLTFDELKGDFLQLFNYAAGTSDFAELIPSGYMLNSGVVYLPAEMDTRVKEFIRNQLKVNWPQKWAYYQLIWNQAYYLQFDNLEKGRLRMEKYSPGRYNWLVASEDSRDSAHDAKIIHLFTSRGIRVALESAENLYSTRIGSKKRYDAIANLSKAKKVSLLRRVHRRLLARLQ